MFIMPYLLLFGNTGIFPSCHRLVYIRLFDLEKLGQDSESQRRCIRNWIASYVL